MVPEPGISAIFPSCGSVHSGSPFPPQGPLGQFPYFTGSSGYSDFLPAIPVRLSSLTGTTRLGGDGKISH